MYHGLLRKDDAEGLPACDKHGTYLELEGEPAGKLRFICRACTDERMKLLLACVDVYPQSSCPRCKDYVGKCGHCGRKL